jgi:hypothetical protein
MFDDFAAKDVILSAAAARSHPPHRSLAAAEGSKAAAATRSIESRPPRTPS